MGFTRTIDREKFIEQYNLWKSREISIKEAMDNLGIKTRQTWYTIKAELKAEGKI